MKVAYLVNVYPKTSHSFIRREIHGLEAAGAEVLRVSIRPYPEDLVDARDLEEARITRVLLKAGLFGLVAPTLRTVFSRPLRFWHALRRAWSLGANSDRGRLLHAVYLAEACALLWQLRAEGVEHVHAHFGTNPPIVALLCRTLGGPPYSFTVHGPEEFDRPNQLKLGAKIQDADFVVAISEYGRSQLYRWSSYENWKKLMIVHCGVDDLFLEHTVSDVPDTNRLVCVGRLCEQKGQLLLVEAAARLRDSGVSFELVLVGDGEMRAEVEDLIRTHNLEDSVRITGWMSGEQVRAEMVNARAFVLPSFAEGLPVVLMEALALGRPVISTYVAGIPELVVPGECGWLVAAGDVPALADAMQQALSASPSELSRMGSFGRERVREQHDAAQEAKRLFERVRRAA